MLGPPGPRDLRLGPRCSTDPPSYVKPFVERQKNDAADAEAICEASQRPTMRFVQVKSETSQAAAVVFRARDLLVRQRTQIINALRGHLAEFGFVVAKGPAHVGRLIAQAEDQVHSLPEASASGPRCAGGDAAVAGREDRRAGC